MKRCSKCNIEDISCVFKKSRNICKKCINIQDRLWRNKNIYCDLSYKSYYIKSDVKKCSKCFSEKDKCDFRKGSICKLCIKTDAKSRHNRTYISIKQPIGIEKYCKNCNIIKKIDMFYKHSNICKLCKYNKWVYRESKRKKEDPIYRFKSGIRSRISIIFKRGGFSKKSSTFNILGCSFNELTIYLESKFESWMTWENRGLYNGKLNYGWDLDHIIPLSLAKTEYEIIKLNHYTNLQPLCSKINRDVKKNNTNYENKTQTSIGLSIYNT